MQKEKLSALMDGEAVDTELLDALSRDDKLQQSWQSYHLIRDTLRGDIDERVVHLDISARVAAALVDEPVRRPAAPEITENQPHPALWRGLPFWGKARPWVGQVAQIGVAACVSLAVIVGVQNYNRSIAPESAIDDPAFATLPALGTASPVSLGVPAENVVAHGGQRQVQAQRERINAILQDYELQRRLHAERLQIEQHEDRQAAAVQVPGTQSLGSQPQ